jgi:hypothetical protein
MPLECLFGPGKVLCFPRFQNRNLDGIRKKASAKIE